MSKISIVNPIPPSIPKLKTVGQKLNEIMDLKALPDINKKIKYSTIFSKTVIYLLLKISDPI